MNHPTAEKWMSYLYDELNAGELSALKNHLGECAECRERLETWRSACKGLDAWSCPPRRARKRVVAPFVLKWAAAAGLILCVGFGVGRFTSSSPNSEKIRAALEPQIRQELRSEFAQMLHDEMGRATEATLAKSETQTRQLLAAYDTTLEAKRAADQQAIYAVLDQMDSQRVADYLLLKKDLDTVAVNTDVGLRQTEQRLVQLADYVPPSASPTKTRN